MHGDLELATIDLHQQVVVIDALSVERVIRCSLDWVRPRAAATGHKIGHPVVFLMLVIVHVSREHHEASMGTALPILQYLSQQVLRMTC